MISPAPPAGAGVDGHIETSNDIRTKNVIQICGLDTPPKYTMVTRPPSDETKRGDNNENRNGLCSGYVR